MKGGKFFRKLVGLTLCAFMFVLCFGGGLPSGLAAKAEDIGSSDESYVLVDGLFPSSTNEFDQTKLLKLLGYVTGIENFSFANMDELLQMSKETRSAEDINKTASEGKTEEQDIVICFDEKPEYSYGQIDCWTVTYLSQDKNGDIILTLLDDSGRTNLSYFNGGEQGFNGLNNPGNLYPSASYGTSYIRAVTLNNGGGYLMKDGAESLHNVQKDNYNYYSRYTCEKEGADLTDFIVKPVDVAWQENGESAKEYLNFDHYLSNENWSTEMPDELFDTTPDGFTANMAMTAHNTVWKNDYLWLPSLTEVGFSDTAKGMWEMSAVQRQCHNADAYNNRNESFFTRSAVKNSVSSIFRFYGNGYVAENVGYTSAFVRPAFHLNITKALLPLAGDVTGIEAQSQLKDGDTFSASKVNVFNVYTSGFKNQIHEGIQFNVEEGEILKKDQVIEVTVENHFASFKVLNSSVTKDEYVATTSVGFKEYVELIVTDVSDPDEIDALLKDLTEKPTTFYSVRTVQVKDNAGIVDDQTVKVTLPVSVVPTNNKVFVLRGNVLKQIYASEGYYTLEGADNVVVFVENEQQTPGYPQNPGQQPGDTTPEAQNQASAPKTLTFTFGALSGVLVVATIAFVVIYLVKVRKKNDD